MNTKHLASWSVAFLLAVQVCPVCSQESDFFWSLQGLNSGAVNEPLHLVVQPGQTHSLYLYYTSDGPSDIELSVGALLDIATSRPGIIRFTAAESFDFPIVVQDIEIGGRWTSNKCGGAAGEIGWVSDELINEWGAFAFFGDGLIDANTSKPIIDTGYDSSADAFLFGRIDFEVVGETGCVQVLAGRGRGGIVNASGHMGIFVEPVFGSALISIGDVMLGDTNGDGELSLLDVEPFIEAFQAPQFSLEADTNCDGFLNLLDIQPFVSLINGDGLPVGDPTDEDDEPVNNLLGDVNNDGFINLADIPCFAALGVDCPNLLNSDINGDGSVNLLDLCPLLELILAQD